MPDKEFFVGYEGLAVPLAGFYRKLVAGLILAGLLLGGAIGFSSPDAGSGQWDIYNYVDVTGQLHMNPYPMLVTDAGARPILVTSDGKRSARPFLEGLDGQRVTLHGNMATRGQWQMLTIAGKADILAAEPVSAPVSLVKTGGSPVALEGEIVDSKCMLGAMRPGEGYVHRACASLCLMGGMPPMALLRQADGSKAAYLLVGMDGAPLSEALSPQVAVPVAFSGFLEFWQGMPVVRMNPAGVARLEGDALAAFGPSIGADSGPAFCRLS